MASIVAPGHVVGTTSSHVAGPGTHVHDQNILASITGSPTTLPTKKRSEKPCITILHTTPQPSFGQSQTNTLPIVASIVLCRVIRVQQRQLITSILVTNPNDSDLISFASTTNDELQFQAILRKEDVRAYEKDKVIMNEMFRVGDIVRATIISLGDERSYYISTAGNEYGVVIARSEAGNAMLPASWKEMVDVITGKAENRKVAKPV